MNRRSLKLKIQNEAITDLSDYTLSQQEKSILLKGLNYIPDQNQNLDFFKTGLDSFIQNIYKAYHFRDVETPPPILFTPSKWKAPPPKDHSVNSLIIEMNSILSQFPTLNNVSTRPSPEMKIILNLLKNPNLIFKKADKGGGIVLFNKKDYISLII